MKAYFFSNLKVCPIPGNTTQQSCVSGLPKNSFKMFFHDFKYKLAKIGFRSGSSSSSKVLVKNDFSV